MNSIYQPLRAAVDDLRTIRIGLKQNKLTIEGLKSGSSQANDDCERFKLCFPVAGNITTWELVFDKKTPIMPPDVIFGTEDEDFFPDLNDLEGYVHWDSTCSSCLSKLLTELIKEYSMYHRDTVCSLPKFKQQWIQLCQSTNFTKNCEVHFVKNPPGTYNSIATFLFQLPLDLKDLPTYLIKDNPGDDTAALQLTFQSPDMSKVTQRLFISARVENALGGQAALRLPSYGASDYLKSYIENINTFLASKINGIRDRYIKRKEVVACLIAEFHGSVIEYNVEKFNEITLLLSHNNFFFVLFVILDERFPDHPPTLIIQSVYHTLPKGPYRQTHREFLYSPRWEANKIVISIREYLAASIMDFKRESIRACK